MSRAVIFFLLFITPGLSMILALLGLWTLDKNLLGWVLLVIGIAYPAGAIIFYTLQKRPFWKAEGEVVTEENGDRSFWAFLPGMLTTVFASPLEYMYLAWLPHAFWVQIIGLVLVALGVLLHAWTRSTIKGLYSGHLQLASDHVMITSGPYHYVRHPGYAAFILLALGIAIGYSSIIGLAAVPLLLLPGLAYRIRVEENLLRDYFGDQFEHYAHRVRKLIPGIW